ncbi:MAG TPA: DUF4097 family beta strand repeat-containing protein [Longimicrobiales bacterium]|nr:DUF4097 family beta strand repeat-containing protein [Longimicrobiales bacterium]
MQTRVSTTIRGLRAGAAPGLGAAALALLVIPASAAAQEAETYRLSGQELAVYNLAGAVEVVRGSGDQAVVEVRRGGSDAARLSVEVGPVDGREALRVLYPSERVVYAAGQGRSRTRVRVRDDGTFSDGRGGGDRVEVSTFGSGLEAHADLLVRVPEGRDLSVYLAVGETRAEGVSGRLRIDTGSGRVTTRSTSGSLEVDTGSGSVEVRGARGDVEVDTGSGSVEVTDVTGTRLGVDTGSGSVRGDAIEVERLDVDTGSGRIDLGRVRAREILLDTGSGSVSLELESDVDDLEVDTGSGSVDLWVPAELGARLEVDTGSGGIEIDVPVRIRTARRDHLEGVLGDGRGEIRIDTGSGSVEIRAR